MINRGKNTVEHWQNKHICQYDLDKPYNFNEMYDVESYHYVAYHIISENVDSFKMRTVHEIGCAGGDFAAYLHNQLKDFKISASDFSSAAINAAKNRCHGVDFEVRDFLESPISTDYGIICAFETLEHVEEGRNYEVLDNILNHCEYAIISVPGTQDSCNGEHISHYNIDTFEKMGYNVVWKTNLSKIDMSAVGDYNEYYYMIFLIKGKL